MLFANGESNPEWTEEEKEAQFAAIDHFTYGYHVACGGTHDDDCPNMNEGVWIGATDCYCETIEFSMSRCDTCRNILGGSRHAVTLFPKS